MNEQVMKQVMGRIEACKSLRKQIEGAEKLIDCNYVDVKSAEEGKECFCAVGHIFKLGGMSVQDMIEVLEIEEGNYNSKNGESVRKLLHEEKIKSAIIQAGFDPEDTYHDVAFINRLQSRNDGQSSSVERKAAVLEVIDEYIAELEELL